MSYRANKLRQRVAGLYPVVEVSGNPEAFLEWVYEVKAEAWDEGAEFVLEHIYGEPVDVSEYNPYREDDE